MARKGPLKDLAWGKLNPGKKNSTQRTLSKTNRTSLMSQVRQQVVDASTPRNKPTGPMKAIVLRVESKDGANKVPGSSWMKAWYKEILETEIPETIKIKGRIPTLHAGIPEPEKYGCDGKAGIHQQWINMHPTYYASTQDIEMPECGDIVIVDGGMIMANVVTRENDGGIKKGGACPPSDVAAEASTTDLAAAGGDGDALGGSGASNENINPFMFPEECDWDCMLEIMGAIATLPPVAPGRNPDGTVNTIAAPYDRKGIFISRGSLLDPKMPQPFAALQKALWANIGFVVMECCEQYAGDAKTRLAQKDVFKAYARMFTIGGVRVYISGKPYPGKAAKFVSTLIDYADWTGAKGIVMEPKWGYVSPGDKDKYSRQAEYLTSAMMRAGKDHGLQVGFTNPWLPSATYSIAELDGEEGTVALRYKDSFPYACFSKVDWSICQVLSSNGKSEVEVDDMTGKVSLVSVRGQNALKQEDFVTALEDYVKMGFKNIIPAFGVMGTGYEDYRVSSEKPPGRVRDELEFLAPKGEAAYIGELRMTAEAPRYLPSGGPDFIGERVQDWSTGYFGATWYCEEDDPDPRCACEGWDTDLLDAPCHPGLSLEEFVDIASETADLGADLAEGSEYEEGFDMMADALDVASDVIDEVKDVTSQVFPRQLPEDPPIKSQIRFSVTWWDWLNAEEHTPCWKSTRWDIIKNFHRYSPLAMEQQSEGSMSPDLNLTFGPLGKKIQEALKSVDAWNNVAKNNPALQKISLEQYMMAIQTAPSMASAFPGMDEIVAAGRAASHVAQSAATELGYDGIGSGASDVDAAIEDFSDSASDIADPGSYYGSDPIEETDTTGAASGTEGTTEGTGTEGAGTEGTGATSGGAGTLDAYPAFSYINFDGGRNPNDQGGWYPAQAPGSGFRTANRTPAEITHFVVHTTAGHGQDAGGDSFARVEKKASTHYGINQGGWVFQFVQEKDVCSAQGVSSGFRRNGGWGLTCQDKYVPNLNDGGLSVEVSGIPKEEAATPGVVYNDAVYENLAFLIANCCHRNQIPVDRMHIFGHDELSNDRSDPGTALHFPYPDGISYPMKSTVEGGEPRPGGSRLVSYGINAQGNQTFDWVRLLTLITGYMNGAGVPMPPAQEWDSQGSNAAGASVPPGSAGAAGAAGAPAGGGCGGGAGAMTAGAAAAGAAAGSGAGGAVALTAAQIANLEEFAGNWPLIPQPVDTGQPFVTSNMGARNVSGGANFAGSTDHAGYDIVSRPAGNVPITAVAPGTVTSAGWANSGGNWVVIDHGNGVETKYMHLDNSTPMAAKGAQVTKGQIIGIMGTTGQYPMDHSNPEKRGKSSSTGVHLHFECKVNGTLVNPLVQFGLQCVGADCP
jgi:hypothetical protein